MRLDIWIDTIYDELQSGEMIYMERKNNLYYFHDRTHEVCFDINDEIVYIAELTGGVSRAMAKITSELNLLSFNYLVELIITIVVDNREMNRLEQELEESVKEENYEKASVLRDVINHAKDILK
jgi:hypothetical protein